MRRALMVCFLLALVAPGAAAAATRYADPVGTSGDPCTQAQPCGIVTAINSASSGDTVIVNSGTYGSAASPIATELNSAGTSLTIQGAGRGANRPVIYDSDFDALDVKGSASDLTIIGSNPQGDMFVGGATVVLEGGATGTRLYASQGADRDSDACDVSGNGVVLTDSVCWAQYTQNDSGLATFSDATLRNDTFVGSTGLFNAGGNLQVVNCILYGLPNSTSGYAADYYGDFGSATFTNVEYHVYGGDPDPSVRPTETGTVSAAPKFVDAANGDFHEAAGAPSIDAGVDDPANGTYDLNENLRELGGHTDIGAYEFVPTAPSATATAATAVTQTSMTLNGALDAGGAAASYHFVWGTSPNSLTTSTPTQWLPGATGSQAVSADLTGLSPGQTYYYALVVHTDGGDVTSNTASSTTATTRYADPGGTSGDPCTQAQPCDIVTAINSANAGDTVIVNSGTYGSSTAGLTTTLNPAQRSIDIQGAGSGSSRPTIYLQDTNGTQQDIMFIDGGASDLTIRVNSATHHGVQIEANSTVDRVLIIGAGNNGDGCDIYGPSTVRDTVCFNQDPVAQSGMAVYGSNVTLRNDTAIGNTALYNKSTGLTAVNSIAYSPIGGTDYWDASGQPATLSHDEFRTAKATLNPGTKIDNQVDAAPTFVDPVNGDFDEAAGSPSIDAGVDDPANGTYDLDGNPRQLGTHTDIGAYESKLTPTVNTTVRDVDTGAAWSGNEQTGARAADRATVTGANGVTPGGKLTYSLYDGGSCGGQAVRSDEVTLAQNGSVPDSPATSQLAAGSYSYQAHYGSDANYASADASCEPFSVGKATPGVTTTVRDADAGAAWSGDEKAGARAFDRATVTGVAGFAPTGKVTYSLYNGNSCTGQAIRSDDVTIAAGSVPDSPPTGQLAAGSYSYQAAYNGDDNYAQASARCEPFAVAQRVVEPQPSAITSEVRDAATHQVWTGTERTGASAYDTAKVTGASGLTPAGTVTYLRWNNASCSGPAVDTQTVTLDSAGTVPDGQATAPLKAGHYSFRADYSGDPSLQASTGACEPFAVLARGRFRVFHVHVHHDGVVSFDATVPGAGYVGVLETAWKKTEAAHPAAVVQRPKPGRFAFARAHLHPTAPGTLHVTVNPNDRGQKLIADHHGRVFIRLWVIYVPPAGGGLKRHGFVGLFVTK